MIVRFIIILTIAIVPFLCIAQNDGDCNFNLPPISYMGNSTKLSASAKQMLEMISRQIKDNPECRIRVEGHATSGKTLQQLSWDRVYSAIAYLVERTGISESRFVFDYGNPGNPNQVEFYPTMEDGPQNVPAPHPNLRRKN
jgi:OmpA-OmpF porin, OOP family